MRELDLEPAFACASAPGENIEDQLGAIQHLATRELLKVTTLGGESSSSKIRERHVLLAASAGDLLGLALADIEWRGWFLQFLDDGVDHLRAGGGGELTEFGQRIFNIPTADSLTFQTDQEWRFS